MNNWFLRGDFGAAPTNYSALIIALIILRIAFFDRFLPSTYTSLFAVRFALTYVPSLLVLILANISFTLLYQEARAMDAPPTPGGPPPIQP